MNPRSVTLAALTVGLLAVPAAADASIFKFGSDLTAPANRAEAHGADAVFWNTALPNGRRTRVPAKGQVLTLKLKGTAIKRGGTAPRTLFHFQVLHPQPNGSVKVSLTSGPFHVPVGGDKNRVTTYHPVNLCAKQGDYVAFNDTGGFNPPDYPNGTPFRVFSSVANSTTSFFSSDNGTNNGSVFTGSPHAGEQLLMKVRLGTGQDSGSFCR
jgi:hypothetical protein